MPKLAAYLLPPVLLLFSNGFMTLAWYGHLKFKTSPLWVVVLGSWGIALIEYCLAVPANRWGSAVYTAASLKAMQEVITLGVFAMFSVLYLNQAVTLRQGVGFVVLAFGAFLVFTGAPAPKG